MPDSLAIGPVLSIRDVVYEKLKDAILSGSFDGNERLVESDLAARLHVSRTPVREALRRLESEGILEALPKQGLVVKRQFGLFPGRTRLGPRGLGRSRPRFGGRLAFARRGFFLWRLQHQTQRAKENRDIGNIEAERIAPTG